MDIAALSTGLSQNRILSDVGTAMLSKSLDMAESQNQMLASTLDAMPASAPSLESLVNPAIGGNIDIQV